VNSVQVIIGYKGLIDLARRSGQIVSIAAHEVCANDKFELVYGLDEKLIHTPSLGERGELIGFYAVAKLKDGGHSFEFMSLRQVQEIMAATQSKGKYGPWKDNFTEMGRKTVIRRLAKYLPLSIEFQTAVALDNMAEGGKDQHIDTIDGEFAIVPDDMPMDQESVDQETGEIRGHLTEQAPVKVPAMTGRRDPAEFAEADGYGEREQRQSRVTEPQDAPAVTEKIVLGTLDRATDTDTLDAAADLISEVEGRDAQDRLTEHYKARREALMNPHPAQQPARRGRRDAASSDFNLD
jgi:recombination protein RecT